MPRQRPGVLGPDEPWRISVMRGHWFRNALVGLALLAGAGHAPALEQAAAPAAIDLQATGTLVMSWGARPSFPESVTFAYYHAYMARALGREITAQGRQKIIDYLVGCQQPDGGFTPEPAHSKASNVIYTYYALRTLELLGKPKAIDREAAARFLRARIQANGGIAATAREGDPANLATTFYGIESLGMLDALDAVDRDRTVSFLQRYREPGMGFTRMEGGVSIPRSTFMGVRLLATLGILTVETGREVLAYLKGSRYSGLVTDRKYRILPGIEAMAATLEALDVLASLEQIDTAAAEAFINSLYVSENGGFGPRPGLGTTPPATYHAIVALVMLGRLPDPLASGAPVRAAALP